MLKIVKESKENELKELDSAIRKEGFEFPFYMLHVYIFMAGKLTDERTWFVNTYKYNDEEFYGSDRISLDFGVDYAMDRLRSFKKFKQKVRAEKFAESRNNWNMMYELKVEKIEKVEDLFI